MKIVWGSFFGQCLSPSWSKDPEPFKLLFKGTELGSPQLNELFTNQVVHRVRILQYVHTSKQEYICIEQQEIVKEQCNKERDKITVKDP